MCVCVCVAVHLRVFGQALLHCHLAALPMFSRYQFLLAVCGCWSKRGSFSEICCHSLLALVAPYCAIPRDDLSDTPLLRAMGFLVSQHGQLGAILPPPFLSVSPLESMRSGGAIPPLKRGISAILARHPIKTRQMGAIPPLRYYLERVLRDMGGVSHTGPLSCLRWKLHLAKDYRVAKDRHLRLCCCGQLSILEPLNSSNFETLKVNQKRLRASMPKSSKSDSKLTRKWLKSLSFLFPRPLRRRPPRVTLESLSVCLNFGSSGLLGRKAGHNFGVLRPLEIHASW